jgi:hypothetical protein
VDPLDAMKREDFKDALDIHFGAPFNVRLPPYLTCLKAVSPASLISPLSEGNWQSHI